MMSNVLAGSLNQNMGFYVSRLSGDILKTLNAMLRVLGVLEFLIIGRFVDMYSYAVDEFERLEDVAWDI